MKIILLVLQILIAAVLIFLIAIQGKGGGLGSAFGASTTLYSKRRGVEKTVFYFTIFLVFLFFIISLANLLS